MEPAGLLHLRLESTGTAASGTAVAGGLGRRPAASAAGSVSSAIIWGALTMGSIQDADAFGIITDISTSTGSVVL